MTGKQAREALDLKENVRRIKAKEARYRKPICKDLNFEFMRNDIYEMQNAIGDVIYTGDTEMEDLIGEEEWQELRMTFTDLDGSLYQLEQSFTDDYNTMYVEDTFDLWMVALAGGNGYDVFGYDDYEEDYFELNDFEANASEEIAGEKLMRMTKKELIASSRTSLGVALRYIGIRQRYNDLQATIDIIRGDNAGLTAAVERMNELYEAQFDKYGNEIGSWEKIAGEWRILLDQLPDRVWIE